jgi:hypothetical protein
MSTDPNDLMFNSGSPSAKFESVGALVKGTIVKFEAVQQRDFKTGLPETWDDGNPKMQLVFTVATDDHDPTITDDDGHRRIYAPVSKKPGSMCDAIRLAVKEAGADKVLEGGMLAVKFDDTEAQEAGLSPRKLYVAQYAAPTVNGANDLLGAAAAPAAAPPSLV